MTSTGDNRPERPEPENSEGDYSYDLAHEEVPAAHRAEDRPHRLPLAETDTGGDYSYDLAHEVPPSRPR